MGPGVPDPARLGHGIGTEAILLALRWGFEGLGLHRVSLTVVADNNRAVAAYTRCGFVVEGRFRDSLWLGEPTIPRSLPLSVVVRGGELIAVGGDSKQQVFALEVVAELLEAVGVGVEPCASPYYASESVQ